MRVDAHQHYWKYSRERYDWIDGRMAAIARDFGPDDLAPLLDDSGFDGSVAVQARQDRDETDTLLRSSERDGARILGVVGWVDLRADNVRDELEVYASHPRFVGVRHIVQDEPDDRFLLRDDFCRGIACLGPLDLTYDILIYPSQLDAAVEFAERFSEQRLVVDHMAKPFIARGDREPWASTMRRLASRDNVYCKISGLVTEAEWTRWRPEHLHPYLDVVVEAFGPRRLMVGSDWPVCTLAASYREVMDVVLRYIEPLTKDEKAAILGETAAEFYKLEALSHAS